jgi:hypothetical protein
MQDNEFELREVINILYDNINKGFDQIFTCLLLSKEERNVYQKMKSLEEFDDDSEFIEYLLLKDSIESKLSIMGDAIRILEYLHETGNKLVDYITIDNLICMYKIELLYNKNKTENNGRHIDIKRA